MGHAAGAAIPIVEMERPKPPEPVLTDPQESLTLVPDSLGDAKTEDVVTEKPSGSENLALDPRFGELGPEKIVATLLQTGKFHLVEQIAEADPDDLTQLEGIGPKTAAALIVKAAEIQAERAAPDAPEGGAAVNDPAGSGGALDPANPAGGSAS